jgi:hypothetical protein
MTPKEKAIDLVDKFNQYTIKASTHYPNGKMVECKNDAKQCALIAVDEIIEATKYEIHHAKAYIDGRKSKINTNVYYNPYWQEVKQEIKKL